MNVELRGVVEAAVEQRQTLDDGAEGVVSVRLELHVLADGAPVLAPA